MKTDQVLDELQSRLMAIPSAFVDDGCSSAPDRWLGLDLTPACRVHDHWYCTRAWPAGALNQLHRSNADQFLGLSVRALLPFGTRWLGWWYYRAVHQFGGDQAYDSCDWYAGEQCRHNLPRPKWMKA